MFVFATLFSQVIILNMLIAIMGDTFDRVQENAQVYELKLKFSFIKDYSFLIPNEEDPPKHMFIAKPKNMEETTEDLWYGKIYAIRKTIEQY